MKHFNLTWSSLFLLFFNFVFSLNGWTDAQTNSINSLPNLKDISGVSIQMATLTTSVSQSGQIQAEWTNHIRWSVTKTETVQGVYATQAIDKYNETSLIDMNRNHSFGNTDVITNRSYFAAGNLPSNNINTLYFNLDPDANLRATIGQVFPAVVSGVTDGYVNFQNNAYTAEQMHQTYLNQSNQNQKLIQAWQNHTKDVSSSNNTAAGSAAVAAGNIFSSISDSLNRQVSQSEKDRIMRWNNDVLTYRQFQMTEKKIDEINHDLVAAIKKKNVSQILSAAEATYSFQEQSDKINQLKENLRPYFNESGILNSRKFRSSQDANIFDNMQLETHLQTPEGQILVRQINRYQQQFIESNELNNFTPESKNLFFTGAGYLRQADKYFSIGKNALASAFLKIAKGTLDQAIGFTDGFVKEMKETAQLLPFASAKLIDLANQAFDDPIGVSEQLISFTLSLPEVANQLVESFIQHCYEYVKGDEYTRGRLLGSLSAQALVGWVTGELTTAASASIPVFAEGLESLNSTLSAASRAQLGALLYADPLALQAYNQLYSANVNLALSALTERAALAQMNNSAAEFIDKIITSKAPYAQSSEDLAAVRKLYSDILQIPDSELATKANFDVVRAIPKEVEVGGQIITKTESDVFETHSKMKTSDGRYSIGGPLGNMALYTTIGADSEAMSLALRESDLIDSKAVIGKRHYEFNKVLDLTEPATLSKFNFLPKELTMLFDKDNKAYKLPQIIGDIFTNRGYDAIIVPSAVNPKMKNLIVLIRGAK